MNEYSTNVNLNEYSITINQAGEMHLNGKQVDAELTTLNNAQYLLRLGSKTYTVTRSYAGGGKTGYYIDGNYYESEVFSKLEKIASAIVKLQKKEHHRSEVKSPMPGLVLKLRKEVGEYVEFGDSVMILEAMKMENDIKSPYSGILKNIYVSEGDAVEKGALLFYLEQ